MIIIVITRVNQKFCNILVRAFLDTYIKWLKKFKPEKVITVVDSIVVVGVMTCVLFHFFWFERSKWIQTRS